jgi:hypothetical protein
MVLDGCRPSAPQLLAHCTGVNRSDEGIFLHRLSIVN